MTDTTMGGGRGGVGIRLFVQGGEVVKRTFGQIGDSGRKMWAEIALGEKSANPAFRAMSRVSNDLQGSFAGLAGRAGAAGNALTAFGAAGVVAAAGLAAIAIGLTAVSAGIQDATRSAAELTDVSDRIGIGTEALQEWRYVADEAGVGIAELEAGLEKLNGSLGAFKLGIGDAKLKPVFEELGITQAQLENVRTSDELMLILADRLGQVQDRASQVRLARALGIEELLPILRLGSDRIRELSEEAENLGFVLEDKTVRQLDEADRSMERAGQQMRVLRDTAVAPLAEAFADAAEYVAGLAVEFHNIEVNAPGWIQTLTGLGRLLPFGGVQRLQEIASGSIARGARERAPNTAARATVTAADMQDLLADPANRAARTPVTADDMRAFFGLTDEPGGYETQGHTRGGGGASAAAREAEQQRREHARAMEALDKTEEQHRRARIEALYGPGGTQENEHDLALARVTLDLEEQDAQREALRAQLEKAGALDEAAKLRLEELRISQHELAKVRDTAILRAEERELIADRVKAERARDQDAVDLLTIDRELAETARERIAIARRILLLQQEIERKALEAAADADGTRTADEQAAIDRLLGRHGREVELFDHNAREDMRAEFHSYGREIVDAIEDGRLGEHIADQLKERLIQHALDGLFDMLNPEGGPSAGGGGFWSFAASTLGSLFGQPGPGRAGGGSLIRGVRHPIAETGRPELLMVGGSGQVTSAAETARLLQQVVGDAGGANGGRIVVEQNIYPDFRGALMTEDLVAQFNAQTNLARSQAIEEAVKLARKGTAARQVSLRKLGT